MSRSRIRRTLLDILVGILCLIVLALFLENAQTNLSVSRQEDNSYTKLAIAEKRMYVNALEADDNFASYDSFSQAKVDVVAYFLDRNPTFADVAGFASQWGLEDCYLLDDTGKPIGSDGAEAPDFAGDETFAGLLGRQKPVTVGKLRYYAAKLAGGGTLIGTRDAQKELAAIDKLRSPSYAMNTIKVGSSGYLIAVDLADGTVAYHPNGVRIGQVAADHGLDPALYPNGTDGWVTLEGSRYYCVSKEFSGYLVAAVVPEGELAANNVNMVTLALIVAAAVLLLLITYAVLLRKDQEKRAYVPEDYWKLSGKLYVDRVIAGKIRNIAIIGIVAVFGTSLYIQSLAALSRQSAISETKLAAVSDIFEDNKERIANLTDEYATEYGQRAKNIAYTLKADPTMLDNDVLTELAKRAQISAIYVFNKRGVTEFTNSSYKDFKLSSEETDQSYAFWDVVRGYKDSLVQSAQSDDTGNMLQYVGVKRLDAEGMVQIGMRPKRLANRLQATELNYVLNNIAVENGGYLFAVSKTDGTFLAHGNRKYLGKEAAAYGLTAAALADGYTGYQTLDGTQCLVSGMEDDSAFVYVAVPTSSIFSGCALIALLATAATLAAMLVISLFLMIGGKPAETVKPADKPRASSSMFRVFTAAGHSRMVQSAASRWSGAQIPWSERTPEQKLSRIVSVVLSLAALALVVWLRFANMDGSPSSVLAYILSGRWEHTPSLFSLSYIAIVALEVFVVAGIARKLIMMVTQRFGARSETVGRLLDSFIKYVSILAVIFYSLTYLGVDSTTLITSAGLLTLVVGLGAQSLIGDILAGIFIVFEGEFRVGDIVTIGDWQGTVLEIGIRTTKIESGGSDIKIFNNSAISGVVNMTKQYSYAAIEVGIEYSESIERVESILERELPRMKERLSGVIAGPYYKGVSSLGASSVNIAIVAQCKEGDRVPLARALNREIKLIFDQNNISMPFPQIVVNQPAEAGEATKAEKRTAAQFVKEQEALTQNIDDQIEQGN